MTWIRHHTWQSLGTGVVSWHKWYVPFCVWAVLQSSLLSLAVEAQTKVTEHMMDCHKIESPKQLFDRLSEVSAAWKILAEDLGVDTSTIDEIQLDEPKTQNKYRAVLRAWYDSKEPHPCWEPVLAVLRGMGRNRLAGEIDTCLSKGCKCELVPECTGTSQANENARGSFDEDTNYPEATPPSDYSSTGLDIGSVIVAVVIGAFGIFIFIICIRCWTRNQAGKKGNHPAPKSDDRQGQQSSSGANGATNTARADTSLTSNAGQQSSTGASNTASVDASQNSDAARATGTRLHPADLAILLRILQSISRLWKEIGRELGIPAGDLGNIESAPRHLMGAPQSHFSAMLEKWLNWAPPNHSWPTVEQLCSALRSPVVGQENLTNKLEQKYQLQKGENGDNTAAIGRQLHTSHTNTSNSAMGESRECMIVRTNLANTTLLISTQPNGPSWFASKLEEKAFIDHAAGAVVLGIPPYQQTSQLLGAVKDRIGTSQGPEKEFAIFIEILRSNPALVKQAEKLLEQYRENGGDAAAIERQLQPHTNDVSQPAGATASSATLSTADTPLSETNKFELVEWLERIGNNRDLLRLGEGLGLTGLRKRKDSATFLDDLVGDWLERKDRVDEVGRPTWRKLVEVLRKVGQNGLANDIEKKFF